MNTRYRYDIDIDVDIDVDIDIDIRSFTLDRCHWHTLVM